MKRLYTPVTLIAHATANVVYFYDPNKVHWQSMGWATYFHCVQSFALFTFCFIFGTMKRKSYFDRQFMMIEASYSFVLATAFALNYRGVLLHTYGLNITGIAIAVTTTLIIFSGIKHGYFKHIYENG